MKRSLKISSIILTCIFSLILYTYILFYAKYKLYDRSIQLLYASDINTDKIKAPDFTEELIKSPTSKGNAADHYMLAKSLLEKNDKFLNALRDNRFKLDYPEKSPNDIEIDQSVLTELVKATSMKECRFVPKFLSIPDDPDKSWPNPPSYLLYLPYVLIAAGNKAFKEENYDLAGEMYGKTIIMGSHLINERFTPMFVTLGYIIQGRGCRHLLELYWEQCNHVKGKIVENQIHRINDFHRQLSGKALVIEGIQFRYRTVPNYLPNHIEIVTKVLLKDEDPMFRIKAALELRKLKLSSFFYFESKVAQNALNYAANDPHPQVRRAVQYAIKYDHDDLKRENVYIFDAAKEIMKNLSANPKSKWLIDLIKKEENPIKRQYIEEVIKESKTDLEKH